MAIATIQQVVYERSMENTIGLLRITNLGLRILLCRHLRIEKWGPVNLNWPIWRFYWNATPGAHVAWEGRIFDLGPSTWMLIPPHTPAVGRQTAPFEHFFLHFSLNADCRLRGADPAGHPAGVERHPGGPLATPRRR